MVQAVQRLANSSPKQSAQYGFSSRLVNRWPASDVEQLVHVKHSRCHGSLLYVTPPDVMICKHTLVGLAIGTVRSGATRHGPSLRLAFMSLLIGPKFYSPVCI